MGVHYIELVVFVALVIATAVVVPVEFWMLSTWRESYFRSGLCVFERRFQAMSMHFDPLPTWSMEDEFGSGLFPPIGFSELSPGLYGFRETYLGSSSSFITYLPVMRGAVVFDMVSASVSVKGYINWYVIVVSALFVFMALPLEPTSEATVLLGGYAAIVIVIYSVQVWRYGKVAAAVEESVSKVM